MWRKVKGLDDPTRAAQPLGAGWKELWRALEKDPTTRRQVRREKRAARRRAHKRARQAAKDHLAELD